MFYLRPWSIFPLVDSNKPNLIALIQLLGSEPNFSQNYHGEQRIIRKKDVNYTILSDLYLFCSVLWEGKPAINHQIRTCHITRRIRRTEKVNLK